MTSSNKYRDLGTSIGELVSTKNQAYGDSFAVAGEFLKILWPDGVPVDSYGDMLCIIRIFDKLKRIATDKTWNNESPYKDITGYGLLGLAKDLEEYESRQKTITLDK